MHSLHRFLLPQAFMAQLMFAKVGEHKNVWRT
jgi:hypothetical protein